MGLHHLICLLMQNPHEHVCVFIDTYTPTHTHTYRCSFSASDDVLVGLHRLIMSSDTMCYESALAALSNMSLEKDSVSSCEVCMYVCMYVCIVLRICSCCTVQHELGKRYCKFVCFPHIHTYIHAHAYVYIHIYTGRNDPLIHTPGTHRCFDRQT